MGNLRDRPQWEMLVPKARRPKRQGGACLSMKEEGSRGGTVWVATDPGYIILPAAWLGVWEGHGPQAGQGAARQWRGSRGGGDAPGAVSFRG